MNIGNSLTLYLTNQYANGDIVVINEDKYQIVSIKTKHDNYTEYTVLELKNE